MTNAVEKAARKPRGPHRLNRTVKEAFEYAFNALQENKYNIPGITLEEWAMKNPAEFYKMATKLIPSRVEGSVEGLVVNLMTGVPKAEPKPEPIDFA